jgi:hypothetical protein
MTEGKIYEIWEAALLQKCVAVGVALIEERVVRVDELFAPVVGPGLDVVYDIRCVGIVVGVSSARFGRSISFQLSSTTSCTHMRFLARGN